MDAPEVVVEVHLANGLSGFMVIGYSQSEFDRKVLREPLESGRITFYALHGKQIFS